MVQAFTAITGAVRTVYSRNISFGKYQSSYGSMLLLKKKGTSFLEEKVSTPFFEKLMKPYELRFFEHNSIAVRYFELCVE